MKQYKIYKKDTKGKIRYLQVEVEGSLLSQISGIEGSSKPIIHEKNSKGKNIGKKNETTPEKQALLEAEALIKDKLTKGYFETIKEAEEEEVILPMLAHEYKKHSHKLDYDDIINCQLFVQPKLDGMRCLAHISIISTDHSGNSDYEVKLMSREGKIIQNMMHIETNLLKLASSLNPANFPHIIDGELYCHGEDFQTNMSYIKEYKSGLTEQVKFHIYDKINSDLFEDRYVVLCYLKGYAQALKLNNLEFVQTLQVTSEEMMKTAHKGFLASGYEGTMIRRGSGLYKINGRSTDLLKYKDFIDIDCKIIEIGPADKRPTWGRPVVEWNGVKFACNTKMTHEAREDLLTNKDKYIGKIGNVRYFELSNTGVPRFPVLVGIHEDR